MWHTGGHATICKSAIVVASLVFILALSASPTYSISPPALSLSFDSHSARNYTNLERQFVNNYLFDPVYGGTYLTVGGAGNVINDSKDVIFQTNIILFLAGMNTQSPEPGTVKQVDSAAKFVLQYLKWGAGGPGTWYQYTNRSGGNPQPITWLANSEAYVSYGLLWAYKLTGNRDYFNAAQTNLNYQMTTFPDGHILTDLPGHAGDITYRSPERMAYYFMWQLTGNQSFLNYAGKIETAALGRNGWERVQRNGTTVILGVHGPAITDEVLYALATGDQTALTEGSQLLAQYWAGGYYGREDYQDLLTMDLAMWTIKNDPKYQADAIKAYDKLLEFWDPNPPYGFWADLTHASKTCFTKGYPLVDMTPPTIAADPQGQLITAKISDPSFSWLNLTFNGIGVNPSSVYLFYSLNGRDWSDGSLMQATGTNTYTFNVPQNIAQQNPTYLISASDYFNNTSTIQFTKAFVPQQTTVTQTTPPVSAPSGSGFGLAILALGIGGALLVIAAGIFFRRSQPAPAAAPPASPPGAERNLYCRCPYWVECGRVHPDCPTCTKMRSFGACCACYIMPSDYCNHPSGLGPVYGPHVNYGPTTTRTDQPK